jgi:hypothetical protein
MIKNKNLCALTADSELSPDHIYASIQLPQLEQQPFLQQHV